MPKTERRLGGDEDVFAFEVGECLAEDDFALAVRVDVRGIEHVHAGVHADVDDFFRFVDVVGCAPRIEELAAAAECACAEAEFRHLQARFTKLTIFHYTLLVGL